MECRWVDLESVFLSLQWGLEELLFIAHPEVDPGRGVQIEKILKGLDNRKPDSEDLLNKLNFKLLTKFLEIAVWAVVRIFLGLFSSSKFSQATSHKF